MATLKDIAKHAGVSVCTVSRYLNNNIVIKKETEQKIQQAIQELGYVPNAVAKSLKHSKTNNVAVILPKINHLYYSEITSGIGEVLANHHYNLFIYEVNNLHMDEEEIIQLMRENMVAGVIFIGMFSDMSFHKSLRKLLSWKIPVVYMNRYIKYEGYPLVYPNFKKAAELAVEHLNLKNRRKIAIIHRNLPTNIVGLYSQAFSKNTDMELTILEIGEEAEIKEHCVPLLCKNNIDGTFVLNELSAVKITKELIKKEVKVPDDIAVLSLGDSLISEVATPELSCIDLQDKILGIKGGEIILKQIQKEKAEPITMVDPIIIQRQST